MRFCGRFSTAAIAATILVPCQSQSLAPLNFEVAAIHPSGPNAPKMIGSFPTGDVTGGPGTSDPTRITYRWMPMREFLLDAFGVPEDQISGPAMHDDAKFDLSAKIPPGKTREQFAEMLLNLLKERFHLTYHVVKRDFDLYALTIAKGGAKLKDAAPAEGPAPSSPFGPGRVPLDRNGFPQLPPGQRASQGRTENGVRYQAFRMYTMPDLLDTIRRWIGGGRSVDKTGLTRRYDFTLELSPDGLPWLTPRASPRASPQPGAIDDPGGAPTLFGALEKQLGLKLEKSKTQLDVFVIDRMDKRPTEN